MLIYIAVFGDIGFRLKLLVDSEQSGSTITLLSRYTLPRISTRLRRISLEPGYKSMIPTLNKDVQLKPISLKDVFNQTKDKHSDLNSDTYIAPAAV